MTQEVSYLVPWSSTPRSPGGIRPRIRAGTDGPRPEVAAAARAHAPRLREPGRGRGSRKARPHHWLTTSRAGRQSACSSATRLGEIWEARAAVAKIQMEGGAARASRYLSEGPSDPIRGPSRFGFVGRFAAGPSTACSAPIRRGARIRRRGVDGLVELRELLAAALEQGLAPSSTSAQGSPPRSSRDSARSSTSAPGSPRQRSSTHSTSAST